LSALVKKNGIYAALFYFVSMLLPLILAPYAVRVLGANSIGEISYAQAIFIYFQLLAGLGSATYGQRLIAKSLKNRVTLSKAFLEIWLLKIILGLLGIIVFIVSINGLNLPLKILLYVQIVDLAINFVDIAWFYHGIQDFKKVIFKQFLIKIFTVILVLIFVNNEDDGFIYLLCFSVPTFLGYLLMWKNIKNHIDFTQILNLKPFRHLGGIFLLFIPYLAILLFAYVDRLLIGAITNDMSQVGFYDMSFKFVAISIGLTAAISSVLAPNIANAHANNQNDYIKDTLGKALEVSLFFGVIAFLCLYLMAPHFMVWFLGYEFISTIKILQVLSFVALFKAISILLGSGLMIAVKRDKKYILCIWGALSINILLNLLLIKSYGVIGASVATVISEGLLVISLIIINKDFLSREILKNFYVFVASALPVLVIFKMLDMWLLMESNFINISIMFIFIITFYIAILFGVFKRYYILYLIKDIIAPQQIKTTI
jgi:O-antigen/teichoic acid export membrane protein